MSMEITGILGNGMAQRAIPGEKNVSHLPTLSEQAERRPGSSDSQPASNDVRLETLVSELQSVTSALNRRLSFSINRDLGQVVVKVIDRKTDKVIKELPPEELQRLHVRIREAIGLLIDEEI
ncbi:MAG: flagellar protein FlaG [Spirochaetota bacterium]